MCLDLHDMCLDATLRRLRGTYLEAITNQPSKAEQQKSNKTETSTKTPHARNNNKNKIPLFAIRFVSGRLAEFIGV